MNLETVLICLAIFSSSFWGSWHCAAMCGPIASVMAHQKSLVYYQLGRCFSYMAMGSLGGFIGSFFLNSHFEWLRNISGIVFALILFAIGVQTYRGKKINSLGHLGGIHAYFGKQANGFVLGLLSVFLPCAWLYSYIFAAVSTRSALTGGLTLFLFWAGGLPAMSALSIFMRKSIQLAPQRKQAIAGMLLIVAGLYSLTSFYFLNHGHH